MKTKSLPPERFLESLTKLFLKKVAETDKGKYTDNGYWKWISTTDVANDLGISISTARNNLHKLVKEGKAIVDRCPIYFGFAAKSVEGFKEGQFSHYRVHV
jgi:hypothetical protein